MNLIKNKLIVYSLILSFLGFIVATYLSVIHFKNAIPPCHITSNCEKVLTSEFASIGPIPLALFGSFLYLSLIILCILILTHYKKIFLDLFYVASVVGFGVSIILLLIQAYIINAFCQYCLTSEAISTGIVILAFMKYRQDKKI